MNFPNLQFRGHPLLPGGNLQTLAGLFLPRSYADYNATQHLVPLVGSSALEVHSDGTDHLLIHDDAPDAWQPGDPTVVLLHGMGGSHASPYVRRMAEKLNQNGVRTFRSDMRGCGAAEPLARGGTHNGSWEDVGATLDKVAELCPDSPTQLIGYSLGGSLALNVAALMQENVRGNLTGVCSVCPPVDLHSVDVAFNTGIGKLYSKHFARTMWRTILRRLAAMDNPPPVDLSRRPRSVRELDEQITAPHAGYQSAQHYYDETSVCHRLADIRVPTLIIAADDDPVIPVSSLKASVRNELIEMLITRGGGHLGFMGPKGIDPDRRWLDWRILEWSLGQFAGREAAKSAA